MYVPASNFTVLLSNVTKLLPRLVKEMVVVVILSSQSLESWIPLSITAYWIASWMSGRKRLGPSVKSRIVRILPRMGTESVAELLNWSWVLIPTVAFPPVEDS